MAGCTATATSSLTSLDFEPVLPCEHSQHAHLHLPGDPAAWIASYRCVNCGVELSDYLLCDSGKRRLAEVPTVCSRCAWVEPDGEHLGLRFRPLKGEP